MRKKLSNFIEKFSPLYLFVQLFFPKIGVLRGSLQSVHDLFVDNDLTDSVAVDLGCGPHPKNMFNARRFFGLDLYENPASNVIKIKLGFESLPFEDGSVDYLSAYDLLEHVPRYADLPEYGNSPFIYLMNECYRVLKKGGVFLSLTPVYPYMGAFQDPTHVNIMTVDTFRMYFSDQKKDIAKHYGITADFKICFEKMMGQHLVAVLKK